MKAKALSKVLKYFHAAQPKLYQLLFWFLVVDRVLSMGVQSNKRSHMFSLIALHSSNPSITPGYAQLARQT